jgi:hypothetical protein
MRSRPKVLASACIVWLWTSHVHAHSGPPFPIVSNRTAGPYDVSIWTDPDATDDGSAAGQFWVLLQTPNTPGGVPRDTRAEVTVTPLDRPGEARSQKTEPVNGELTRQFAAVVLDHEGRFSVRASIGGPLGNAKVETEVDATYDLRPSRAMLVVYLVPFLLVGFLWGKLLLRRRTRKI